MLLYGKGENLIPQNLSLTTYIYGLFNDQRVFLLYINGKGVVFIKNLHCS